MLIEYFNINEDKLSEIIDYIKSFSGRKLVFSLIQENRELEKLLNVEDFIIYDNQDYLTKINTLENIILEVEDNLDLIPSSYKIKISKLDLNNLNIDIQQLNYDNVFVLLDDKLKFENIPEMKSLKKKGFFEKIKAIFKHE